MHQHHIKYYLTEQAYDTNLIFGDSPPMYVNMMAIVEYSDVLKAKYENKDWYVDPKTGTNFMELDEQIATYIEDFISFVYDNQNEKHIEVLIKLHEVFKIPLYHINKYLTWYYQNVNPELTFDDLQELTNIIENEDETSIIEETLLYKFLDQLTLTFKSENYVSDNLIKTGTCTTKVDNDTYYMICMKDIGTKQDIHAYCAKVFSYKETSIYVSATFNEATYQPCLTIYDRDLHSNKIQMKSGQNYEINNDDRYIITIKKL